MTVDIAELRLLADRCREAYGDQHGSELVSAANAELAELRAELEAAREQLAWTRNELRTERAESGSWADRVEQVRAEMRAELAEARATIENRDQQLRWVNEQSEKMLADVAGQRDNALREVAEARRTLNEREYEYRVMCRPRSGSALVIWQQRRTGATSLEAAERDLQDAQTDPRWHSV